MTEGESEQRLDCEKRLDVESWLLGPLCHLKLRGKYIWKEVFLLRLSYYPRPLFTPPSYQTVCLLKWLHERILGKKYITYISAFSIVISKRQKEN